jgi:hypothetical protein
MEENERLNEKEKSLLEGQSHKVREDAKIILAKYERSKEEVQKLKAEGGNASQQLEVATTQKELVKLRTENRTLSHQLSYADTKLRELTRSGAAPVRQSLGGAPGRVTRHSAVSLADDTDSVFKLPAAGKAHTPGRSKTGRTVSESKVRARPPLGSGSLFHQDEEVGEVFSSSYLTDLKDGNCSVLDDTGRMSELARRNTLAPAHLKSAYPIESQFCQDGSVTEESIRHSVLPNRSSRLSLLPADSSRLTADINSPLVSRLSEAASSLSLASPSASTRSKRALSSLSAADARPAKRVPPPQAFTIEAPRPGTAVRKVGGPRPGKQPCLQVP